MRLLRVFLCLAIAMPLAVSEQVGAGEPPEWYDSVLANADVAYVPAATTIQTVIWEPADGFPFSNAQHGCRVNLWAMVEPEAAFLAPGGFFRPTWAVNAVGYDTTGTPGLTRVAVHGEDGTFSSPAGTVSFGYLRWAERFHNDTFHHNGNTPDSPLYVDLSSSYGFQFFSQAEEWNDGEPNPCGALLASIPDRIAEFSAQVQFVRPRRGDDVTPQCTVEQSGTAGSTLSFDSVVPEGTGYLQEWTFSDGSTSTANSVSKVAIEPGPYSGTFRVYRTDGSLDKSITCTAEVKAPTPSVDVRLVHDDASDDSGRFALDEEFDVVVAVSAANDGVGDITSAQLDVTKLFTQAPNLEVLSGPTPALANPLTLTPGAASQEFTYRVKAAGPGRFSVDAAMTAMRDGIDRPVADVDVTRNGSVSGFAVEIIFPDDVQLEPLADGEGEDDDGDGLADTAGFVPQTVPVRVKVTNDENGVPIKKLTLLGIDSLATVVDIDLVGPGSAPGVWNKIVPQPLPFHWNASTLPAVPDPEFTLAPGASHTFEFDVVGDRAGSYEFSAVAIGVGNDVTVTGSGNNVLNIGGEPVLSLQLKIDDIHGKINPTVDEGNFLHMTGLLENISAGETIELEPIRLQVEGGLSIGPVELTEQLPEPGVIAILAPTLTTSAPDNRLVFKGGVDITQIPGYDWSSILVPRARVDVIVSGEVVNADGVRRPLQPSDVVIQWGTGETTVGSRTFLQAGITPKPRPARSISGPSLHGRIGELGATRALQGLQQSGVRNLAYVKQRWIELGSNPSPGSTIALVKYAWSIADHYRVLYTNLDPTDQDAIAEAVAADVSAQFTKAFDTAAAAKAAVDSTVTEFFVDVDKASEDAGAASVGGNLEQLADAVTRPVPGITGLLAEEISGAILISWMTRVGRGGQYLDKVIAKVETREASSYFIARETIEGAYPNGLDPRLAQGTPAQVKALPAAVRLDAASTRAIAAIDPVSDANLRKMTDYNNGGLPIVVAVRSRSETTLLWLNTPLGIVLKPFTVKIKTASRNAAEFLGYRPGVGYGIGDEGSVVLARPIPKERIDARVRSVEPEFRGAILEEWADKWDDWYGAPYPATKPPTGKVSKAQEMLALAPNEGQLPDGTIVREGFIGVPARGSVPVPQMNSDTLLADVRMDQRRLQLRKVDNPPDSKILLDDGSLIDREYWEVWIEDTDKVMKRVGGDVDIVSVNDLQGTILASAKAERVAIQLQHAIDAQHPWSSTLTNPALRDKFLDAHRWHDVPAKRGEPLIVYVGGEAYVGWFDAARSISSTNPLESFRWFKGGPNPIGRVNDLIDFGQDLRGKVARPRDIRIDGYTPPDQRIKKALGSAETGVCTVQTSRGVSATAFRVSAAGIFQQWVNKVWSEPDPAASCPGGAVVVLPETGLTSATPAGATRLPTFNASDLGFDSSMFQVGDEIIVGLGTDHEESRFIVGFGSIIIDRPLEFDHSAGEAVLVVAPVQVSDPPVTTDPPATTTTPTSVTPSTVPVGQLPSTGGGPSAPLVWPALLLIALGAALVGVRRRRPQGRVW